MHPIIPETFKARKWIGFLPLILLSPFLIIPAFKSEIGFKEYLSTHINTFLLLTAISIIFSFILSKISITINNNGIRYKRFSRTEYVSWDKLFESEIIFTSDSKSSKLVWIFKEINDRQIKITTIFFSKKDKQKLAEILINQSPRCYVSDMVKRFAANNFPWYYF